MGAADSGSARIALGRTQGAKVSFERGVQDSNRQGEAPWSSLCPFPDIHGQQGPPPFRGQHDIRVHPEQLELEVKRLVTG